MKVQSAYIRLNSFLPDWVRTNLGWYTIFLSFFFNHLSIVLLSWVKYFCYDGPYTVEANDNISFVDTRCMSVAPDLKKKSNGRLRSYSATSWKKCVFIALKNVRLFWTVWSCLHANSSRTIYSLRCILYQCIFLITDIE